MTRSWDDLIADGLDLKIMEDRVEAEAGNIRWLWGDLALEVAPMGKDHARNKSNARLSRFVEELNGQLTERHEETVSLDALMKYRQVADAWPLGTRFPSESWSNHLLLVSNPDREEIIANPVDSETGEKMPRWTWRQLQRHLGQKQSPNYIAPPVTTEDKASIAADLLAQEGVAELVVAEPGEALANVRNALAAKDADFDDLGPRPAKSFDEQCAALVNLINTFFVKGARLLAKVEEEGITPGGHAELALAIYQRLAERNLDAEIRDLLEAEAPR